MCNTRILRDSDRTISRRQDIHPAYNVLATKKFENTHRKRMGEPEDCVTIAKWSGGDVIILHTETDRCTIIPYRPNTIETKTVAKLTALK